MTAAKLPTGARAQALQREPHARPWITLLLKFFNHREHKPVKSRFAQPGPTVFTISRNRCSPSPKCANQVKKDDLPKSYQDLLNPKWRGKLGIETEAFDWFAAVVTGMGEENGLKLFRDIVAANGVSVRKGHSLLNNMVVAGEVPLALTVYNYMPEAAKKKGAPIDWFALEPAIARANGIGIARRAPHANAALLFYDYMLSAEAQKILASMNYVPTNATVESPLKNMKVKMIDPAVTLSQMEKWTKAYDEVVLKKGGR